MVSIPVTATAPVPIRQTESDHGSKLSVRSHDNPAIGRKTKEVRLGSVFGFGFSRKKIPEKVRAIIGEEECAKLVRDISVVLKQGSFKPLKLIGNHIQHTQLYYYSVIFEMLEPYLNLVNERFNKLGYNVNLSVDARYRTFLSNHETFYLQFNM